MGNATRAVGGDLGDLVRKVHAGRRLSFEDGLRLYASADVHTLGELADLLRQRRHGRTVYYNINRHINYTNYCILRCRFCSFYRPYCPDEAGASGADGGYTLSLDEIVAQAGAAVERGASEVHIVGGLHPALPFEYYLDMCRGIRAACPGLHIKAFTAVEIIHFTRISRPRLTIAQVLERLRAAGLDSLPGGGAEIFAPRVQEQAFKHKMGEVDWFAVHKSAHEMGIFSNASMLYGHVETPAERLHHLLKLREHQDASLAVRPSHFNCVVPLPFIPAGSALKHLPGPSGLDDLRTLAITRLMLDNVPHIKAFWVMLGAKLAQVSLNWGVDDLDGTVVRYDVTKADGRADTHQELTVEQIQRLITAAGGVPVERDSLYRRVIRTGDVWQVEGAGT